ncbi:extensin-like domain-containing protein [Rhizobium rhizoryzae]|uniref:extensin-like domain-containing protein n=1 Tax=Rhizobium rhizoryzae TaxID=451876 RepID=UPI0028A0A42C|nr:extensin family protein [Rhizobium rhizoryzae]
MMMRIAAALLATISLTAASLPTEGPLPEAKPAEAERSSDKSLPDNTKIPETKDIPTPAAKPQPPAEAETPGKQPSSEPQSPTKPGTEAESKTETKSKTPEEPAVPNIIKEDPQAYAACLSDLKAMGAEFTEAESISEEDGTCGIEKPIRLTSPLPGIKLSDPSPLRCEAALALSHWLKDTVQPALKVAFPDKQIVGVRNAASYACRKRNHAETGKISEHAKGNAIDVIALEFDKGDAIEMKPKTEDPTLEGAFQRTATAGACLHFRTVLSPGSDATHEDHLHLDVLERKGDYRYCR